MRAGEALTHSRRTSLPYFSLPLPALLFTDRFELRLFWIYPELSESVRAGETLTHSLRAGPPGTGVNRIPTYLSRYGKLA